MNENVYELIIEPQFERLSAHISDERYMELEKSLLLRGCIEPICIWNNMIIDGHKRYRICKKNNIPFSIAIMMFRSKAEAISWICADQLKKNDLSEEMFRYLIGKRYQVEKVYEAPNSSGYNQYSEHESNDGAVRSKTAIKLGAEYHVSHATVCKYAMYTAAVDVMYRKAPDIIKLVMDGKIRISQENMIELSKLTDDTVRQMHDKIIKTEGDILKHYFDKRHITRIDSGYDISSIAKTSIKDMPKYDPDAELESLALTIPSWISSIKRVQDTAEIRMTTFTAKFKLTDALIDLVNTAREMIKRLEEG